MLASFGTCANWCENIYISRCTNEKLNVGRRGRCGREHALGLVVRGSQVANGHQALIADLARAIDDGVRGLRGLYKLDGQ